MTGQPAYARIRERVREQILSGVWAAGTKLPTEAQLQAEYGVGRVTAQQALRDLAKEGMITRHRGRGSYVAESLHEQSLLKMVNFLGSGPELPGTHEVLSARVVPAGDLDLRRAGAATDEPVFDIRRTKGDGGQLVALERTHVPFRLAPHLLKEPLETVTIYDYLRRQGVRLGRARMYVRPYQFDAAEASLLRTDPNALGFAWERITYLESGGWAEVAWFTLRADAVDFFVEYDVRTARHR